MSVEFKIDDDAFVTPIQHSHRLPDLLWHIPGHHHRHHQPCEPSKARVCEVFLGWCFFMLPFIIIIIHFSKVISIETKNRNACTDRCKYGICLQEKPLKEINNFECSCYEGISGANCTEVDYPCAMGGRIACDNFAECYIEKGQTIASCRCRNSFYGHRCHIHEPSVHFACMGLPCDQGLCNYNLPFWGPKGWMCACFPGFRGLYCHEYKLTCDEAPCINDGLCTPTTHPDEFGRLYTCKCPDNVHGENCELLGGRALRSDLFTCYRFQEDTYVEDWSTLTSADMVKWGATYRYPDNDSFLGLCSASIFIKRAGVEKRGPYKFLMTFGAIPAEYLSSLGEKFLFEYKRAVEGVSSTFNATRRARSFCFTKNCLTIEEYVKSIYYNITIKP